MPASLLTMRPKELPARTPPDSSAEVPSRNEKGPRKNQGPRGCFFEQTEFFSNPCRPCRPPGMAGACFFGCSVIVASVVTIKPAIDAASWRAVRTTLVGSMSCRLRPASLHPAVLGGALFPFRASRH